MNSIHPNLKFTMEIPEDFDNGKLPTLDTQVWLEGDRLMYSFYEKPMAAKTVMRRESALSENTKVSSLSQDLIRRLKNINLELPTSARVEAINDFASKLMSSGYTRDQTRTIVVAGIKGYEKAVKLHLEGTRKLHRSAMEGAARRYKKKLLDKSNWFKGGEKKDEDEDEVCPNVARSFSAPKRTQRSTENSRDEKNIKACTVLFVDQTPKGALAAVLRKKENELARITGWKAKVVEKSGTSLQQLLVKSNPWEGGHCGRQGCVPCGTKADNSKCFKRNILYETSCNICMREGKVEKYVGETSRSGFERGGEHVRDCKKKQEDSHMWKHMETVHGGVSTPDFSFKVVKTFQSALMRQVAEAVRIEKVGKVLNSKGMYNRCSLPRLTVQQNDKIVEPESHPSSATACYDGVFTAARDKKKKRKNDGGDGDGSCTDGGLSVAEGKRRRTWGMKERKNSIISFLYSKPEVVHASHLGQQDKGHLGQTAMTIKRGVKQKKINEMWAVGSRTGQKRKLLEQEETLSDVREKLELNPLTCKETVRKRNDPTHVQPALAGNLAELNKILISKPIVKSTPNRNRNAQTDETFEATNPLNSETKTKSVLHGQPGGNLVSNVKTRRKLTAYRQLKLVKVTETDQQNLLKPNWKLS